MIELKHLYPINREQEIVRDWLVVNNFKEPTEQDFPTYLIGKIEKLKGPYLEDAHYAWKNKLFTLKK